MTRFRRLLRYIRPYTTAFGVSAIAASVASVLDGLTLALLIPFLQALFRGALGTSDPTVIGNLLSLLLDPIVRLVPDNLALVAVGWVVLAVIVAKNLASYVSTYLGKVIEEGVVRDIRCEFFAHLQRMPLDFFGVARSGQLVSRMFADVDQVKAFFSSGLQAVVRNGVLILVYGVLLFGLSWRMALIVSLLAPALATLMRPLLHRVRRRAADAYEARGQVTAIMNEAVAGARLVKVHAAENYEAARFSQSLDRYRDAQLRAERLSLVASPVSEMVGALVFVTILVVGSWAVIMRSALPPEVLVAFLVVSLRLLPPLKKIAQFPAMAEQALVAAERVFDILDTRLPEAVQPNEGEFHGLRSAIRFRGVWFRYRGDWVLRGVNLTVKRGDVVAIVGPSGAGKSTLVDLLPRIVDPERGEVLFDGTPTTCFTRPSLRSCMTIVSQDPVLFNDTVHANIAYGVEASRASVMRAARIANAHRFIAQLPGGYDSVLGERGSLLSGGERQRIAIARALLRNAPILILDEATSALDDQTDQAVQAAIARLMQGRTVLIIAHRLSTVRGADKVAVLDGGRLEVYEDGQQIRLVQGNVPHPNAVIS